MLESQRPNHRVIAHLDLDCFYCQVEHRRLNIPSDIPLAVQQWQRIVAVNYEARKKGVKRGDLDSVARDKCPNIQLVHVETLNASSSGSKHEKPSREHEKISLERYRQASSEIFSLVSAECGKVERASIDEAYLDLTDEVSYALQHASVKKDKELPLLNKTNTDEILPPLLEETMPPPVQTTSIEMQKSPFYLFFREFKDEKILPLLSETIGGKFVMPSSLSIEEISLLIGAVCVYRIRQLIFEKLHFTVSAGISHNKLLSKIASAMYKPNKQAIVLHEDISLLMSRLKIKKLRGLGGKLGNEVLRCLPDLEMAQELQNCSLQLLRTYFGESSADFLWKVCRGIDEEKVVPNLRVKSMMASKTFNPQNNKAVLQSWLRILAEEIQTRMLSDAALFSRRPKTLILHHQRADGRLLSQRTRSGPMPRAGTFDGLLPTLEQLFISACHLLDRISVSDLTPCIRIGLGASDFEALPSDRFSAITDFFKPKIHASASPNILETVESYKEVVDSQYIPSEEQDNRVEPKNSIDSALPVSPPLISHSQEAPPEVKEETVLLSQVEPLHSFHGDEFPSIVDDFMPSPPAMTKIPRDETHVHCEVCGETIAIDYFQIHFDHHVAVRTFQEYNPRANIPSKTTLTPFLGENRLTEVSSLPKEKILHKKKRKKAKIPPPQPSTPTLHKYFDK
ncbi:ImpB/MucB/SamB family protein [Cardiosporidium cionae]|uniref:DNA polymerase eta n=1 Tax=Cardiosporidium cionae TaxID=476202 RepID=A0ABQ7JB67_9APIC|nr:ImpB/MucB/SamB family protein [Cardiosporidium cionae]|eukprot:KAF8821159.1 ImpB/MucB/SamB family protein [Cardiosporidium cionae]